MEEAPPRGMLLKVIPSLRSIPPLPVLHEACTSTMCTPNARVFHLTIDSASAQHRTG